MISIGNFSIHNIESISEDFAKKICEESAILKGFSIYFVNFGGNFGYSYLVFKNSHHISYANDYELHHNGFIDKNGKSALKEYYIKKINDILFTEEEIAEPIKDYDEYTRKEWFLRNFYGMQVDNVSIFYIGEDKKAIDKAKKEMIYNPVAFAYMQDADFVKKHVGLFVVLNKRKEELSDNFEYQKNQFLYEMFNHEYGINLQRDFDVLSVFGNITYKDCYDDYTDYFDELNFTETQRRAYLAARSEYFQKTDNYCQ